MEFYSEDNVEQVEVEAGAGAAQEDTPPYCVPCKGNICYCEDERQVTYFTSDAEYYEQLEKDSNVHPKDLDEDQKYWSSDDEASDSEVPGVGK